MTAILGIIGFAILAISIAAENVSVIFFGGLTGIGIMCLAGRIQWHIERIAYSKGRHDGHYIYAPEETKDEEKGLDD